MQVARLRALTALLALAASAACGSTVQVSGTVTTGQGTGGDGLSLGPGQGLPGTTSGRLPGTTGTTGGGTSGTTGGTTAGTTGSGTGGTSGFGTASSTGGTGGTAFGNGPGVTDKEVYVGLIYDANAGAVNEAAGVGSITSGDSMQNENAIIADINAHGGVAGRRLVPVYAQMDSTSPQTLDQQYAAVCDKFAHDKPRVFAVAAGGSSSFRTCLAKAGIVHLSSDLPNAGAAEMHRLPTFLEQGYPNVDRLAAYQLTPLVDQDYFSAWDSARAAPAAVKTPAKVGILTYDDTTFSNGVDRYLVPGLKRLGYDPVVQKVGQTSRASDISSQAAAVQSAELAFASSRVTHLILFETNGGLSVLFLAAARSQGYYPRLSAATFNGTQALIDSGAYDTTRQFNGAVGYGWVPSLDLRTADNPPSSPYSNDARRHCLAVLKAKGITFDSGNAEGIALNACASLYLLQRVANGLRSGVNAASFMQGIGALGTSFQKPGGFGLDFRPGVHDPANQVRYWRFTASCSCMRYYGGLHTVP